ncbi:hypothetical protein AZI86_10260 [Bdellovibrio bacteriovorus]|uniref:M23ase beta-sheet core domain-containing protein n=1 Tax=Bdellovibrio bacteriovorus TaxID=959 RepID=A0A150WSL0_BDEBC|nr:peptidoglycan DD-metalloendopeptidase family protein [Bdellovibrio bacteriovorus]KYG67368.1 hypothetical protein AZI86_10260 [Bdellovibrio bacteriovorus]
MNYKSGLFSMLSLVCLSSFAHAAPVDLYWHNNAGFVSASKCQITSLKEIPFYISQGKNVSSLEKTELQTPKGSRKSFLLNRSLVRISTEAKTRPGYKYVDVIGVSQTPKAQTNKWFADRMDNGYIAESSLKNLEDYVIEIKSGVSVKEIPGIKIPTVGTFWQLATEKDQVQSFTCTIDGKARNFMIFEVFTANSSNPVARVGVNADHTGIFRSILTHLPSEADVVLDSRMDQAPTGSRQSLESGVGSSGSVAASPLEVTKAAADEIKAQKEAQEKLVNKPFAEGSKTQTPPAVTTENKQSAQAAVDTAPVQKDDAADDEETEDEDLKLINSKQEHVVCINEDTLNVRDESLEKVLFKAEKNETVLPFQSWGAADTKKKVINGKEYTFVKIQFPEKEGENIGWLAQDYVKLEGQCSVAKKADEDSSATRMTPIPKGPIKNINDAACCGFPTIKRPTQSYLSGMRRFKAGRSKGKRLHAACDLYRYHGEAAVSIADGKVSRGLYYFYQNTYALDVQYPGGFVARYGELTGKAAKGVSTGAKVTRGQVMGYIGTVSSNCCPAMLHFELYSGTKKGGLSARGNKFGRRSDLMDPTKYLLKWEKNQFGTSY